MIFCNGIKVGYKAWRNPPTYLQCFKKSRSSFNLCTRVTQGYVRKWYLSNTKPNFQFEYMYGYENRILLISNTYHLAQVILLHRAFLFSTTKSEWEINLFIQAESEVEIVRFCLVVRCVFCIKEEEVEDKLCSNTWNSTFIFAL